MDRLYFEDFPPGETAEYGDYTVCIALEKPLSNGKSNSRRCTCHYSDFFGKCDFQASTMRC